MAIVIDTSRPLRSVSELEALVRAVVRAHEHDESEWLEWKLALDLSSKEGCFAVARAILGMANRQTDRARLYCGGLGYIVVGAEPGTLVGLESVDPATLSQIMDPYLGGALGPRWSPTLVGVDGVTVLVVTVEAPEPGDPIFPLRRTLSNTEGTVFVRKLGRTAPADARDMDALGRRLLDKTPSGADLEVELLAADPFPWLDVAEGPAAIRRWADAKRARLIEHAKAVKQRRQEVRLQQKSGTGFSAASLPTVAGPDGKPLVSGKDLVEALGVARRVHLAGFTRKADPRSLESYVEQVDQWRDDLVNMATEALPEYYMKAGNGVLRIQVKNTSRRFLQDVELDLILDWEGASLFEESPQPFDLPRPPRTFGEPSPAEQGTSLSQLLQPHISPFYVQHPRPVRRALVLSEILGIRYRIGNLPQGRIVSSEDLFLVGVGRPASGTVVAMWDATIRVPEERLRGACEIPVANEPVPVGELFDASGGD